MTAIFSVTAAACSAALFLLSAVAANRAVRAARVADLCRRMAEHSARTARFAAGRHAPDGPRLMPYEDEDGGDEPTILPFPGK